MHFGTDSASAQVSKADTGSEWGQTEGLPNHFCFLVDGLDVGLRVSPELP